MALKLKRKGDTSYLQDHNLLKNLDLEDQHPISAITGLQAELDKKMEQDDLDSCKQELEGKISTVQGDVDIAKSSITIIQGDITTIEGDLVDILNDIDAVETNVNDIVSKIESGEIGGPSNGGGGGSVELKPLTYVADLEYEGSKITKETYTGETERVVVYEYNGDNVISKTVTNKDGSVKVAAYEYDENKNLVRITDSGTDFIYMGNKGSLTPTCIETNGSITSDSFEINVLNVMVANNIGAIINTELLIKNDSTSDVATIVVSQGEIEITNTIVEPNEIQKYAIGSSKSIIIVISGSATYTHTLNGFIGTIV